MGSTWRPFGVAFARFLTGNHLFFLTMAMAAARSLTEWAAQVRDASIVTTMARNGTTFGIIADIRRRGTTVLMVEQNAYAALRMADRAYVMETGRIVLEGAARDLLEDDHVRRAYLGG